MEEITPQNGVCVCVAGSCGESYYILRTTLLSIWKFAKGHLDKPEGYWKKVTDDSKIERFGVTERNSGTGATHQLSITVVAVTWFRAALLPAGTGVACSHWQNYDVESGQQPIDQPSLCVFLWSESKINLVSSYVKCLLIKEQVRCGDRQEGNSKQ